MFFAGWAETFVRRTNKKTKARNQAACDIISMIMHVHCLLLLNIMVDVNNKLKIFLPKAQKEMPRYALQSIAQFLDKND